MPKITFEDGTVIEGGRFTPEFDELLEQQLDSIKKQFKSQEYVSGHYRVRNGQEEWVRGHYRNRQR